MEMELKNNYGGVLLNNKLKQSILKETKNDSEGNYKTYYSDGKITVEYQTWRNMMTRCYNESFLLTHETYHECTVCNEWHDFNVFAEWFSSNYYEIEGEKMQLDKDILIKHNKVYSPSTCVIVPQTLNLLFVKRDKTRGDLVIGVTHTPNNQKFISAMCQKTLGIFDSELEAFEAYKEAKEKKIKEMADSYKSKIPLKVYEAMCKYEVEITD